MPTKEVTLDLPIGNRLTITADAASTGHAVVIVPGQEPSEFTAIAASSTTKIGPFTTAKHYRIVSDTAELTQTVTLAIYDDTAVAITGGTIVDAAITTDAALITTSGVGAKNGATVSVVENGNDALHRTILTCAATTITISDESGVGQYGGVKLYDFPEGMMCIHGAVIDGSLTAGVTGTIIATFDGDVAVGTATASEFALPTTEEDIMPSVALTTASGTVANSDAVSVATALTESGARWHDGTVTAKDLYLNFGIDDDASHTAGTATFTGTVTVIWSNLGDK